MKSTARSIVQTIAALALLLFFPLAAGAQDAGVAVTLDGNALNLSPAPIINAGRVFVPLRGVFEGLGASVVYANGTINATGNGREIALQIGSTQATVNGAPQTIDVAPFIIGASTFVPLRFVSEALGASVNWDEGQRLVAIETPGGQNAQPAPASVPNDIINDQYADTAPPPLPAYDQPVVPAPNEIWQPGYWAWGPYGYYWVPGTWVQAPQAGYLWTPGYWHYDRNRYAWSQGYWATSVGFYGGVNYGFGYFGLGYVGGRWAGHVFTYNTYVSHVNVTVVHNVYVDRTVIINRSTTRVSYNGGPHGITAHPTVIEQRAAVAPHLGLTESQRQHIASAAQDRSLLAKVNHNLPPVKAIAAPLSVKRRPVTFTPVQPADRLPAAAYHPAPRKAPATYPAAVRPVREARPALETRPAPAERPAPAMRPAPVERPAPASHPQVQPARPPAAPARVVPQREEPKKPVPHETRRPESR